MPRGKKRAEPDEPETDLAQKHRSVCKAVDDGAAELLCPITQELPIDPVMAEDGRVYDRSAIEQWLATNQKSPHTNEPMGPKLIPALQVKNVIAGMVKSGALSGDKCEAWTKKLKREKAVAGIRAKADAGDVDAMNNLGVWYRYGFNGLAEDQSMAFYWFKRGADLDDPAALSNLADCYYEGRGNGKGSDPIRDQADTSGPAGRLPCNLQHGHELLRRRQRVQEVGLGRSLLGEEDGNRALP